MIGDLFTPLHARAGTPWHARKFKTSPLIITAVALAGVVIGSIIKPDRVNRLAGFCEPVEATTTTPRYAAMPAAPAGLICALEGKP